MPRRRFDHLVSELSVRVGRLVPRYAPWLRFHELKLDPEWLTRGEVLGFVDRHLAAFLVQHGLRLRRVLERHDPLQPTPDEWLADL